MFKVFKVKRCFPVLMGFAFLFGGLTGCNDNVINKATVSISQNLETVTVTLLFDTHIQSDLSGAFTIGSYGDLFIDPFTTTAPFAVGFGLNTTILNDQKYVNIAPTTVLPNQMPLPVGLPMVEISPESPISSKFNIFGYLDVSTQSWIGVGVMFQFLVDQYFPAGMAVNEVLLRDSKGNPEVAGSVFGPILNSDGTLKQSGGITLFANVRQLVQGGTLTPDHALELTPIK